MKLETDNIGLLFLLVVISGSILFGFIMGINKTRMEYEAYVQDLKYYYADSKCEPTFGYSNDAVKTGEIKIGNSTYDFIQNKNCLTFTYRIGD